jgi:hypothetical protein
MSLFQVSKELVRCCDSEALPVYETELVNRLNGKCDLGHVETSDVLCEDLVLDEHGHQITTRQELHKHVEEGVVLEGCVQLDDPWAVRLGKDITLRPYVGQLIFLELLGFSGGTLTVELTMLPFLA